LGVNKPDGSAGFGITRTGFQVVVLAEPPFYVIGGPRVQRTIGALQYINRKGHVKGLFVRVKDFFDLKGKARGFIIKKGFSLRLVKLGGQNP